MYSQEKKHLQFFEEALTRYRSRPTLLQPVWSGMGFLLGLSSALGGKEAAMACTVAVETEIGEHYNNQLRQIIGDYPEERELRSVVKQFRDDELGHLSTGLQWDAEKAPAYHFLSTIVRGITRTAVYLAERI